MLRIPKKILAQTNEMPLDEANKTIEILTSAIDEIYEERAAVMDYQKLFE